MQTLSVRALSLVLVAALVPACATRTGKVAGVVSASASALTVAAVAAPCSDSECEPIRAAKGSILVGTALIALIVAVVAEGRHQPEAPRPIPREPAPPVASVPATGPVDPELTELTVSARVEASLGRCAAVEVIGQHVRTLDAAYFARVFVPDPAIQRCR